MNWFRNLNVNSKMLVSFGLLLSLTVLIGCEGLHIALTLNDRIQTLYGRDVTGLSAIKDLEVDKALIARCSRNAILDIGEPNAIAAQEKDFVKLEAKLKADLSTAESTESSSEGTEQLRIIRALLPEYNNVVYQVFQAAKARDGKQAKSLLQVAGTTVIKRLNDGVKLAAIAKQSNAERENQRAEQEFRAACTRLISTLTCAILLGLGISFWLARLLARPITSVVDLLQRVAAGDLTGKLEVQTRDELGLMAEALNTAIDRIARTLAGVNAAAKNLTSTSKQLANAAGRLAVGTQEQASSLEETSASLEQITATVRNNSSTAAQANLLAASSSSTADSGGQVVSEAVSAMAVIRVASAKIASIIDAVEEIAFKTNMLAVNAAIEAARAGEEGRGFAVVATEVRALAQQSSKASLEIRALIADSVASVNHGSGLVDRSGQTLKSIVASITSVSTLVEEIAAASQEQTLGIEHVGMAMAQMDTVMQQNASQTEELSSTAEAVASQALKLEQLLHEFVLS